MTLLYLSGTALTLRRHEWGTLHGFRTMWLVALELRDWRTGLTRPVLYRRHVRYMLGSMAFGAYVGWEVIRDGGRVERMVDATE